MKMLNNMKRLAVAGGIGTLLGAGTVSAQTSIQFELFNEYTGSVNLSYVNIEGLIVETPSGVSIRITNASDPTQAGTWVDSGQPTITRIFFEDTAGVLTAAAPPIGNTNGVVSFSPNTGTTAGLSVMDVKYGYWADPSPVQKGLDPGEWIEFEFTGPAATYSNVVAAFSGPGARIGMHVQEIGGSDSVSFMSVPIPEPSVALLGLIGAAALLRGRRRN